MGECLAFCFLCLLLDSFTPVGFYYTVLICYILLDCIIKMENIQKFSFLSKNRNENKSQMWRRHYIVSEIEASDGVLCQIKDFNSIFEQN